MCSLVNENVESVEKLFLNLFFSRDKLDVVDDKKIDVPEAFFHVLVLLVLIASTTSLVNSSLVDIENFFVRGFLVDLVGYCLHQVGFADTVGP